MRDITEHGAACLRRKVSGRAAAKLLDCDHELSWEELGNVDFFKKMYYESISRV